jgi:glycosyltransferase involved in cell wall biosynthesis
MSYAESAASAKRRIIIDLRCLQDLTNAERGIPGHARNALLQARMVSELARDAWLIGLIDPALPALPDEIAGAVNELRTNGYFPAAKAGTIFVQPAPMGADQVFVARLLLDQNIRSVAMVYDFIPFDEPEQFAGSVPQRLDYVTALAWLKHYDMFLPISQDTQTRLRTMYPQTTRSFVTGVPITPWLEADDKPRLAPRHILAVAGNNLRKNPEVLIRAHAASKVLQSRKIPLVICGNYAPFHREKFLALAAEHGGGKALLQIPGRLTDAALRAQYQQAICVVTPSRAEGFSMPVIEAMACATPSIVSDIPVHAALVPDSTLRFGPDDDAALAAILERIVIEPGYRDEIIAAQAKIWPQFRASEVARKIWCQIEALAQPELPRIHIGGSRPRIAMLTPLPPAQTGVANYTASTAKALAKIADVSLFSASPESHAAPLSGLAHLSRRFDRVISVIGNSPYHERIYDLALRHGSACICHDARMLFFMVAKFGAAKTASMASAELQRPVSEAEILAWQADEGLREASFFGDLAQAARPLIFHNRSSVALVQHRFNTTAAYLPFAVFLPFQTGQISAAAQQRAREKLGLAGNGATEIRRYQMPPDLGGRATAGYAGI